MKSWITGGLIGFVLIAGGLQQRVFGANLAIVTTADLQSQVFPFKMKEIVNGKKVEVSVGGLGRVSAAANSVWTEMDGTLMVSSGDALMGTFYFMFKGIPEIEAMNRAGYQVIVPGNHEFDQGVKVYANALQHAKFDVVCANLVTTNQLLAEKIKPFVFKEIGGVRVGIFGLITPDLARSSNVGSEVTALADIIPIARRQVANLRAGGAKLVVALTHIGTVLDEELARNVAGIDIIVGGHTHDYLFEKISAPDGRETMIVHAGAGGSKVGVLSFEYAWRVACPAWETVLLDETVGSDTAVTEFLAPYKKKFDEKLSEPIGVSSVDLDGRKKTIRTKESNLGDLIADSWLDWFAAKGNQTNGALVNGGGIRGDRIYPAGQLTMRDILEILPFGNTVYQVKLTGAQLKQVFEISASSFVVQGDGCGESNRAHGGGFLQLSGFRITLNLKGRPFCAVYEGRKMRNLLFRGNRVEKIEVKRGGKWEPLRMDETYKLLVSAWLAEGGDGYYIFPELPAQDRQDTTMRISDLLAAYVKKISPVEIHTEGRIVIHP